MAKISTIIGYIIALLTFRLICSDFSIWSATRSRTMSRTPGRLAGLDHRDVEAAEDLRVLRHRLGEEEAALDVLAQRDDHVCQDRVVRLLLEDHERGDDVHPGLDHRRELAREDLERLRLDALEDLGGRARGGAVVGDLLDAVGQKAALPKGADRGGEVGRHQRAVELETFRVDRVVSEGRHIPSAAGRPASVPGRA